MTGYSIEQLRSQLQQLQQLQQRSKGSRSSNHGPVTITKPVTKEFRASVCRRVLKFKQPIKQPLTTWDDKLALCAQIISRQEYYTQDAGLDLHMIVWKVPFDEDKVRSIVSITTTSATITPAKRLVTTQYGRVCPHCRSNEFLRSVLDFHTNTIKAIWSRSKSELNEYCARCGSISTDGLDPVVKQGV